MQKNKVLSLEDRIPKLKEQRRKKANRRLILLLFMFFILIACVVYIQSPLSHVSSIKVTGNSLYSESQLARAAGITKKDNVWKIKKSVAAEKVEKLPEIKDAAVKLILPNTIMIQVKEYEWIGYLVKEGGFFPVLENGKILEDNKKQTLSENVPVLVGFKEGKALDELAESLGSLPEEIYNSISEIHYTPQKTNKFHVSLFMNDGFEVSASLRTFSEKMVHYPSIASQLDPNIKGVIDLEVGSFFKAYEKEREEGLEEEGER
ncbi:cell division protein FtsQ [Neobacillus notoginsengisoli]|uniref:Cell division protein DivIB n=1 Tax=Neobacillus notoginsengisoli TaxID=1578198 RepID=A0A417YR17_9BACI|nr:FtsQ-type POTRA domain-containing protein [Neobacillus notoginsengisoli]RHW36495.1 cell division protein FtsQ [Neobacillus notoginsengisoli]